MKHLLFALLIGSFFSQSIAMEKVLGEGSLNTPNVFTMLQPREHRDLAGLVVSYITNTAPYLERKKFILDLLTPIQLYIYSLEGHKHGVRQLTFGADGSTLISESLDATKCWNIKEKKCITEQPGKYLQANGNVLAFASGKEIMAMRADGKTIVIKDINSNQIIAKFNEEDCTAMTFNPDASILITGSKTGEVKFWDIKTQIYTVYQKNHKGSVISFAFSPDGRTLASGSSSGEIMLWDMLAIKWGIIASKTKKWREDDPKSLSLILKLLAKNNEEIVQLFEEIFDKEVIRENMRKITESTSSENGWFNALFNWVPFIDW